jgi:hypothetical protein
MMIGELAEMHPPRVVNAAMRSTLRNMVATPDYA